MRKKKKKRLDKKQKLFVFLGGLLLVLFALGMYVNHQMDALINKWSRPEYLTTELGDTTSRDSTEVPQYDARNRSGSDYNPRPGGSTPSGESLPEEELPSYRDIARDVQKRVSKPIDKTDMLRVGLMLVRRLDRDEIKYLYNVGKRGTYTREEVDKTRQILRTRLTSKDMELLREMAEKYDQPLFFIE